MRVIYVDTGMVSEIGHHATSCRLITRALRERGHDVIVAGWSGMDGKLRDEFTARTSFRLNNYWGTDGDPICGWLTAYFISSHATAEDFAALGPFTADDLIFVNSVLPAQLHAIHSFLCGLTEGARPQVVAELGTDPGVDFALHDGNIMLVARDQRVDARATLYRFTGRHITSRPVPELHPVTFDRTSSDVYSMLLGTRVATLPLPHLAPATARLRSHPRTVAFLGHQRGEKGFHLVPEIVGALLAARGDIRVLVHNAQPEGMPKIQQQLREMEAADPRLELDERPAGPEIWRELLDGADIVVCPYVPERFRAAYSALASEAIAAAIPLVLPQNTTLARLLADFDSGGTLFEAHEPSSVVAATVALIDGFAAHAARAAAAAARWEATMGAERMVETMLARLAGAAMQAREPQRLAA